MFRDRRDGAFLTVPAAILLALLVVVVFAPGLKGEFLTWDDEGWIVSNCTLHHPSLKAAVGVFHPKAHTYYQPVTSLSWMLDVAIGGLDPFVFRLNNLIYFTIAVLLLYLLILRLTDRYSALRGLSRTGVALGVALLFALHPAHVESVAWATERKDILSLLLFVACLLFYERLFDGSARLKRATYWVAWGFFLLAILAKGYVAAMAAFLLAWELIDARHVGDRLRSRLPGVLPFFLLAGAATIFYSSINTALIAIQQEFATYTLVQRIALVFIYSGEYASRLFFPFDLPLFYVMGAETLTFGPIAFVGIAAVAVCIGTLAVLIRRGRTLAAGVLLMSVVYLLPGIGLFPLNWSARYLLLPALLPAAGVVWLGVWLRRRFGLSPLFAALPTLFVALIFGLEVQSRLPAWQTSVAFFTDAARQHPQADSVKLSAAIVLRQKDPELGWRIIEYLSESPKNLQTEPLHLARLDYLEPILPPPEYAEYSAKAADLVSHSWRLSERAARAALEAGLLDEASSRFEDAIRRSRGAFSSTDADTIRLESAKRLLGRGAFAAAIDLLAHVPDDSPLVAQREILGIVAKNELNETPRAILPALESGDWPPEAQSLLYETYALVSTRLGDMEQAAVWRERHADAAQRQAWSRCWGRVWGSGE